MGRHSPLNPITDFAVIGFFFSAPHRIPRVDALAKKIEDNRLQLFKGAFSPYKCDALYRLMQLVGEQAEKTLRKIA